jgi:iron complex outermembrane recepter protein
MLAMTKNTRSTFVLRAAILGGLCYPCAHAQTADRAEDGLLDEVVVTAEKRETNLQTTPISISVLGADDLKARQIETLESLADGAIPSLRVAPFFSRNSALTVGIRGIVPFDANQPSRDAGVGVYADGVYLGRSQGLATALYDVERIEVLKGPQGTLFGRNSTGGAVSIVTRKPSGEFDLTQSVGLRNFDGYSVASHLNLPKITNVSAKIDAVLLRRDGTVDNPLEGAADFNAFDKRGVRADLLWEPSARFNARYAFDISRDDSSPYYVQLLDKNPASPALAPLVQVQPSPVDTAMIGVPQEDSVGKTHGHMLHAAWIVSDSLELRSISSYRDLEQSQLDNSIGAVTARFTPNANFARYSMASLRQSQYSQEIQLLGSAPRLEFVAGLFYYHEDGDDDAWTPNTMRWNATGTAATPLPSLQAGQQTPFPDRASTAEADSYAAFGQATWTPPVLDDRLKLTLGARFTDDEKSGTLYKVNGANTHFTFDASSSRVDPAVTVAFDATSDTFFYAKWGTAYRAGGANSRSVNYRSFDPEEVSTYEVGLKSDFWGRRARLNLAGYQTRYTDIQIDFSATNLNQSNRGTLETINAPGTGKIKGFEADLALAPIAGLRLSLNYAYTDGELPQAANPFNNNTLQNVFIVYTPENALGASIDYERTLGWAAFSVGLNGSVADGYHSTSGEDIKTDSSAVFNARLALLGIKFAGVGTLDLALWSRNLFDERHTFYKSRSAYATTGTYGMFNEPRTYGLDATMRF